MEYEMSISRFLTFGLVAPLPQVQTAATLKTFFTTIEKARDGGISYIQLWGPNQALYSSYPLILTLKELADRKNLPIIVNNCADIALKAGLAGVHLGQKDLSCLSARQLLGPKATIGLTVNTWDDVLRAEMLDVNYLGVQVFPSNQTKPPRSADAPPWGIQGARKVIAFTRHPVVLIGNITRKNLPQIKEILRPVDGIAMAGEIMRAEDPLHTAREISNLMKGAS